MRFQLTLTNILLLLSSTQVYSLAINSTHIYELQAQSTKRAIDNLPAANDPNAINEFIVTASTQWTPSQNIAFPTRNRKGMPKARFPLLSDFNSNTAVYTDLESARKPILKYLDGLRGCTALIVLSDKGVYISHYYEDLSFSPPVRELSKGTKPLRTEWAAADPELSESLSESEFLERLFERTVVRGLVEGIPNEQHSLKGRVDKFSGPETQAWILHPTTAAVDEEQPAYDRGVRKIKEAVEQILPGLQGAIRVQTYSRATRANEGLLDTTAKGRMLFMFEPQQVPSVCPAGMTPQAGRAMYLWFEQEELFRREDGCVQV